MLIIQIPGFNSGAGLKAEQLKQAFPLADIVIPDGKMSPKEIIHHIQDEYIDKRKDIHIVGTSLGGFYAMVLSLSNIDRYDIYYYLINPSTAPYESFKDKLGQVFENYKTKELFEISKQFVEELSELQSLFKDSFEYQHSMTFFLGRNDQIINHLPLKEYLYALRVPLNIIESDQDHRHQDISRVIQQIKENQL
jgi:predicted esterase YcpF (UPF0227 family)